MAIIMVFMMPDGRDQQRHAADGAQQDAQALGRILHLLQGIAQAAGAKAHGFQLFLHRSDVVDAVGLDPRFGIGRAVGRIVHELLVLALQLF